MKYLDFLCSLTHCFLGHMSDNILNGRQVEGLCRNLSRRARGEARTRAMTSTLVMLMTVRS